MKSQTQKCVFISGASRGIGWSTALLLAQEGFKVYGTTRDLSSIAENKKIITENHWDLTFVEMDVTDDTSVNSAVEKVLAESPSIDVLINNAGFGSVGAEEDAGVNGARLQFETNYFGTLRLTNAFLPAMRESGHGLIIIVSSMAALFSIPFQGQYVASKRALEGFAESLRPELKPFNIKVSLILPNDIKTEINKGRVLFIPENTPYREWAERVKSQVISNVDTAGGPEVIAAAILKIIRADRPRIRYFADRTSKLLALLKRFLPDETILKLLSKRYGL